MITFHFEKEINGDRCSCFFCGVIIRIIEQSCSISRLIEICPDGKLITCFLIEELCTLAFNINRQLYKINLQDLCLETIVNIAPQLTSEDLDSIGIPPLLKDSILTFNDNQSLDYAEYAHLGTFIVSLRHHVGYYVRFSDLG